MTTAITTTNGRRDQDAALLEQVLIGGNLAQLNPTQRVSYYRAVCNSLGLNHLTKPFEYMTLNGKLVLYAKKDCAEQLRERDKVSITRLEKEVVDGVYVVTAYVRNKDGREDSDIGAVSIEGLKGEAKSNAMMKAITKAKRRATLSICGLGFLDETEIDSIPDARPVPVNVETGEIMEPRPVIQKPAPTAIGTPANIPTNPNAMLSLVNSRVEVPYDNVYHLFEALKQEYGNDKWSWPKGSDTAGWQDTYARAVAHAARKTEPADELTEAAA